MNITEALDFINSVSWKGTMPGLGRVFGLLELMGNPQNDLKYIYHYNQLILVNLLTFLKFVFWYKSDALNLKKLVLYSLLNYTQ